MYFLNAIVFYSYFSENNNRWLVYLSAENDRFRFACRLPGVLGCGVLGHGVLDNIILKAGAVVAQITVVVLHLPVDGLHMLGDISQMLATLGTGFTG